MTPFSFPKAESGDNNMVILIAGPSHTGKTALAQKFLEQYHFPYLCIDHLKMGLIRSGQTTLTPSSPDSELTAFLWPIVREMVKTAIENNQNLIVEGCYIPVNWKTDFDKRYQKDIRSIRLVMSENYIRSHFGVIKANANIIEQRLDDSYCTMEYLLSENQKELSLCKKFNADYFYIDSSYSMDQLLHMEK